MKPRSVRLVVAVLVYGWVLSAEHVVQEFKGRDHVGGHECGILMARARQNGASGGEPRFDERFVELPCLVRRDVLI